MTQTQGPVCGVCFPARLHDLVNRGPATPMHLCPPHQREHDQRMAALDLTMIMIDRAHPATTEGTDPC